MALWIGEQIDGAEGLFYSDKEKLGSIPTTSPSKLAVAKE